MNKISETWTGMECVITFLATFEIYYKIRLEFWNQVCFKRKATSKLAVQK